MGFPVYSCLWWWELCGCMNIVLIKFEERPLTTKPFCRKAAGPPQMLLRVLKDLIWRGETDFFSTFGTFKCILISVLNTLKTDTYSELQSVSFLKGMTFSPRAKLRIPLSSLNCYSLSLSQSGMCFGKFSAPLRLSRKKEAFWLLQQNALLTSAWLMPQKQRLYCLCVAVQEFFRISACLADIHDLLFWLTLSFHMIFFIGLNRSELLTSLVCVFWLSCLVRSTVST